MYGSQRRLSSSSPHGGPVSRIPTQEGLDITAYACGNPYGSNRFFFTPTTWARYPCDPYADIRSKPARNAVGKLSGHALRY